MPRRTIEEPDPAYAAAGRELTFTALRAMVDLDPYACAQLISTIQRPGLEWAFNFMAQSFANVMYAGRDPDEARAAIAAFLRDAELMENARQQMSETDVTDLDD